MIGYLKGRIIHIGENSLLLDVVGVGYRILLSSSALKKIKVGQEKEIYTWLSLKRETIELFGFLEKQEFELFEVLEKMPGVGPKSALLLSSAGSSARLVEIISQKESVFLDSFKGVGQKRLQRVFLELTGRFKKEEKQARGKNEALDGLISLGFDKVSAQEALEAIGPELEKTEEKIKAALKFLGR